MSTFLPNCSILANVKKDFYLPESTSDFASFDAKFVSIIFTFRFNGKSNVLSVTEIVIIISIMAGRP